MVHKLSALLSSCCWLGCGNEVYQIGGALAIFFRAFRAFAELSPVPGFSNFVEYLLALGDGLRGALGSWAILPLRRTGLINLNLGILGLTFMGEAECVG